MGAPENAAPGAAQQALEAQLPQALQRSVAQNAEAAGACRPAAGIADPRLVLQRGWRC